MSRKRSNPQSQTASKPRGCLWWAVRVVGVIIILNVLLFLAAYVTEKIALARLPGKYPPPGQMIDVGDYSLHLHCTGEPSDKPVVVVSAGFSSSSIHWALVQPEVAKFTRICAYDRLGSGYSFADPAPLTYHQEVEDLHTLLEKAGIAGPYVLVGHSYGGAVMQVYAVQYPQDVSAMLMVDARARDMDSRLPANYIQAAERTSQGIAVFSLPGFFRILNWFGLYRVDLATDPFFSKLPPDVQQAAYDLDYNSRMFTFQRVMGRADAEREAQFSAEDPLPDIPMVVIARGIPDTLPGPGVDEATALQVEHIWRELQVELASETSDGTLIVAEKSGHNIIIDQPEIVIDAIRTLVEKARGE